MGGNPNLRPIDREFLDKTEGLLARTVVPAHLTYFEARNAAMSVARVECFETSAVVQSKNEAEFIHAMGKTEIMMQSYEQPETRRNLLASGNSIAKSKRMARLGI